MKLISVLAISYFLFCNNVQAEDSVSNGMDDNSRIGYFSASVQSKANFSDSYGSYSSAGGSLDLMFHHRGFLWDDVGFQYSNFGSLASSGSRNFSLNNLHVQMTLGLLGPAYFKGGYGFSFLQTDSQSAMTVGTGWKWGFGLKFHLAKRLYANVETNRLDGPGPIGFWTQGIGMEYHF